MIEHTWLCPDCRTEYPKGTADGLCDWCCIELTSVMKISKVSLRRRMWNRIKLLAYVYSALLAITASIIGSVTFVLWLISLLR